MIFAYVLILLLGLLEEAKTGCPIRCNCTDTAVNCISKSLEYVPYFESLTNDPIIIDLSGNYIPHIDIDDFSFDKSDQVKEIYLNNSNVNLIDDVAFVELENLQELYLAGNLLNSLPENFVIKNDNLILLDISNNLFIDMPKIRSGSLEVLAAADSGISNLPTDALGGLPNLRVLLLQQNNLKQVSASTFDNMDQLFYVKLSYNPWRCDCKTVNLFDYLLLKEFTDLTETVQCLDDSKNFIDIYDSKGAATAFKDQCSSSPNMAQYLQIQESLKETEAVSSDDFQEPYSLVKMSESAVVDDDKEGKIEDLAEDSVQIDQMCLYLLIFVAIPLSLAFGVIVGSCITYKYMVMHIGRLKNESMKELLTYHKQQFIQD